MGFVQEADQGDRIGRFFFQFGYFSMPIATFEKMSKPKEMSTF
jgi:hypothetical protein